MADSNRPTRTLSDIRRPSSSTPAPAPKKPAKKAAPKASSPVVSDVSAETEVKRAKRSIWKVIITGVIIVAMIALVAYVYYYIFSS